MEAGVQRRQGVHPQHHLTAGMSVDMLEVLPLHEHLPLFKGGTKLH